MDVARLPDFEGLLDERPYVAPSPETEMSLTHLSYLMSIYAVKISISDDFFELGRH